MAKFRRADLPTKEVLCLNVFFFLVMTARKIQSKFEHQPRSQYLEI